MKYLVSLLTFVMCCIKCVAQTYIEPVFDRTDVPSLHINKIEVTKDTTYVYCTYTAIAGSWARISRNTYLYNPDTRGKFQMLKSDGLPISPQKREFPDGGKYQILFCFASIGNATRFDFIEDPNEEAFNIYGIKLTNTFNTSYTETEIKRISDQSLSFDTARDTIKAIQYKEEEKKATAFIYGVKSEQLLMVVYDLCSLYEKYGFNQEANDQKKKITDYIDALNDNLEKWHLLTSLSNVLCSKSDFAKALDYSTKAVEIGEKLWGAEHPKYASSLHNLSRIYYLLGNYEKSIQIGTEVAKIRKKVLGTEHPDYAIALSDLAMYYSANGDYVGSIRIGTEARMIIKKVLGPEHPDYATSLNNLALNYSNLGNYEEAIGLGTEALEIIKKTVGTKNLNYAMLLSNLAGYYSELEDYTKALALSKEVLEIRKELVGMEHPDYAMSLNTLAAYYSYLGNYEDAIRLGTEAVEIRKKFLGTEHPNYAISLSNLATYYSSLSNYAEAARLGTEALEITKKVLGLGHPNYITLLDNLSDYYSHLKNYEEAIQLKKEVLKIRKETLGTEHFSYVKTLSYLAMYYSCLGNNKEAIRLGTEAMEIIKNVFSTEHPNYAISLGNLADYYSCLGNNEEAIRLGTEAMEITKKVMGANYHYYVKLLRNLTQYYSGIGRYTEAIRLGMEAVEITKKAIGTEQLDYATSLSNLALCYSDLGNYADAIRLETEALEITKKVLGTDNLDYATSLSNLAVCYSYLGNHSEAIRLDTEALEITRKVVGRDNLDYSATLGNIAVEYSHLGNYTEAMRLGTEALEIRKKIFGTEHPRYAVSLAQLAMYYSDLGNYEEAARLGTEALEIAKKVLGLGHPDYITLLVNLSGYYAHSGNHIDAYMYLEKGIANSQPYVLKTLTEQSSNLKEAFWNNKKNKYEYIYTQVLPSYVYKYKNTKSVAELYDKTCLFAKGLLLKSDLEFRRLILESGDSILVDKYNALSTNINIYNKLIEKPINERFMNADSLNNVIQQQEMELARESKVYGDYTRNLTSTWKDVRNHLDTDDIAIEFIDFPILGTDSVLYAALTLKKDYESPHMVTLFEKKQLKAVPESAYYTQTDIYDLIWKPLEEELGNVHNIYFAPSGELHRIGIEYIPANLTENISDKYSLHRLSSTRQLALIQDNTKGEKSILYGGINYDENNSAVPDTSTSSVGGVRGINVIYRSNVDSLLLRSSYEYLEGTKMEVDQIANQMKQHQVHYQYYSGSEGSEESFKKLDGTKPKVMHIATHGFYLTEEEAKLSNFARPHMELMMGDNQRAGRLVEDKPMTRSGLLFSGCNHAIHHEQIPDGVEDGILTAQEISTLDLRGLDLVVLSACQTALGDIASGEGVFGLQRGFKKAGAKTIIMSLWKVDDEATRILMVELYKNLMSGKSKQQSLKDAQKYLREYDNGKYDKPKYWASFIMLDGLD